MSFYGGIMFLKTKEEIKQWLDIYDIKKHIINDDLTVDVDGHVDLRYKNLTYIPIKFNIVNGYFTCSDNRLTSLKGAPEKVGGFFDCYYNRLTSLDGAPKKVSGDFYCHNNQLTSLQGVPEKVGGIFRCSDNPLISLEGAPKNKLKQIVTDYPEFINILTTEDLLEII